MEKAADFFADGRKNVEKNGKRNRKIYRKARKKHKKYPDCEEKHAWKLMMEAEKTDFTFKKSSEKAQKAWKRAENLSASHGKSRKIIPTKRESTLKKRERK